MVSGRGVSAQSRLAPGHAGRFHTRALTGRLPRERWRSFRAEAIAGQHGDELAERRWWKRAERTLLTLFLAPIPLGMPAGLIALEVVSPLTAGAALLWFVCWSLLVPFVLWLPRHDFWGSQARTRCRLREFARVNGMSYEPEPAVSRPAAHIFASAPKRRHLDRVEVPGPHGFVVANYDETWDDGIGESWGSNAGYVVFRLRESYPRTLVAREMRSRIKALRDVAPVEGPGKFLIWSTKPEYPLLRRLLECGVVEQLRGFGRSPQIEIVGNELFILRTGACWPMTSERLWEDLAAVAETLSPFLDTTVDPSPAGVVALRLADQRRAHG